MQLSSEDNEGNKINIYLTRNNINDIFEKEKVKVKTIGHLTRINNHYIFEEYKEDKEKEYMYMEIL